MENAVNSSSVTSCRHNPTIKVPVVLTELTLQIDVDTTINLPEQAIEVKRVQKRLKLTQCTLLQNTNKLFVKGFVRKNIEYATVASTTPPSTCCKAITVYTLEPPCPPLTPAQVSGAIKYTTVDVPFSAIIPIVFDRAPIAPLGFNSLQKFEFLSTQDLPTDFPAKDRLESGDMYEYNQISTEFYNELPFCELVCSRIVEYDEFLNRTPLAGGPFEERQFNKIEEKMVIFLTLKILQKQQVTVTDDAEPPR